MTTPDPQTTYPSGAQTAPGEPSTHEENAARARTREAMERARHEMRSLSEQARQQALEAKEQAKTQGREIISERKNWLGDEFHQVSDAVRRAGEELRRDGRHATLTRYTDQVADSADRAASYLWSHEVEDLAADLQDFTRRHPELVMGGLFIAGIAAARFLKATMPEPARRTDSEGYAVGSGEAATTYQTPETYPASSGPGRI